MCDDGETSWEYITKGDPGILINASSRFSLFVMLCCLRHHADFKQGKVFRLGLSNSGQKEKDQDS